MSPDRGSRPGTLPGRIVAALLLAGFATGASGDTPLKTADVVRFLQAGISEHTILAELLSRGFAEVLDSDHETALRQAGASETLVVAIRRAAPAETPGTAATTPAARAKAPGSPPGAPAAQPDVPVVGGGRTLTFSAATRTVRVPVSVVDKAGQPVMGLGFDDFRLSDDGKRQAITLFSGERRALRIAIALDLSGSMANKIRQVEEALKHFIDLLEPADEIMVITFADTVNVVQPFTSDRDLLGRVLDRLNAAGGTALYDAASEAIRRVAPGAAESKAVVLVTDGVDTESRTTFAELREQARRSEVPVFSIALDGGSEIRDFLHPRGMPGTGGRPRRPGGGRGWPPGGGRGGWPGGGGGGGWPGPGQGGWPGGGGPAGRVRPPAAFDAGPLLDLADETGGRAEIVRGFEHYKPGDEAPGSDRLKTAVESIAMTLRHRYLLGYEPPEGKPGWRTIRVDVDRPAATARARKGYYAGG